MPALDEGTTLDMPVTVPRASVTQAADDLKARDALLARLSRGGIGHRQGGPGRHADRSGAARHGRDVRQLPAQGTVAQAGAAVTTMPTGKSRRFWIGSGAEGFVVGPATDGRPRQPGQRRRSKSARALRRDDARTGPAAYQRIRARAGAAAHALCRRRDGATDPAAVRPFDWPSRSIEQEQLAELTGTS